jgi:hypothetical protein
MTYLKHVAPVLLWLTALPLMAQTTGTPAKAPESTQDRKKMATEPKNEGDVKFAQHCSRCHNAPESFSPSISGTIVRHMRVRASLSKQDEDDILRFLVPK